ncbi:hypothetical protein, partial [Staphylococcus pseudintermedius]|uniref:hypothetical protein n=1 Tax=Staphylococcus pseudintermedius TaxID=283734 RepID=UPI0010EF7DB9
FSRSETNELQALEVLKKGFNVAVVFTHLPETYLGYKAVNVDETDLRFMDEKNVIVGLKYKINTGKGGEVANLDALVSGFVVANLSQKKALSAA